MEKTITTMKPEEILVKDSFRRTKPTPVGTNYVAVGGNPDYNANRSIAQIKYSYPTQDDFLREYDPHSHNINSIAYYPNLFMVDENSSKYRVKVRSRVAVAWQRRIHTKRLVALTGYDPDISISRQKTDEASIGALKAFKEGWALKGMDECVHLAIRSDLMVGDAAVCGYKSGGKFGYRIFAYDKGDILYPHYDDMTGELVMFGRRFTRRVNNPKDPEIVESVDYLDVWDMTDYVQYRTLTSWEVASSPTTDGKSEWVVSSNPRTHGFGFCPIAYHRYGEPCWAASQSLIEQNELALSQLAENNAQYALRILYTLGAEFEMDAAADGTPLSISSGDPNAKLGFLESADKSASYELELKTQEREIMRCSFAVETPEIKSGSDMSSLTVKMLNADSYLKALDDAKEYQSFLDDVVDIFIEGYGTESMKRAEFMSLGIKARLQPWVFMSESEVVNTLVQLCSIGVLSKRSATEYAYETLGLGSVDEAERVLTEAHDALVLENKVQTENQNANVINNARNAQ